MKISDMTDTLFDREMQRIMGDVQFWCIRLDQIGDFSLEPTPVSYMDNIGKQPFPLAIDLKEVWDYAAGTGSQPIGVSDVIQSLCELLWCPVAGTSYEIPSSWWDEPLGFMCRLAWARQGLDAGENLTVDALAMLAGVSDKYIRRLCGDGTLQAEKVPRKVGTQQEWAIPVEEGRKFLARK